MNKPVAKAGSNGNMRKVVCFQERLTHYREEFFSRVRKRLRDEGIHFELVHGVSRGMAETRGDSGHLNWAYRVEAFVVTVAGYRGVWLPNPPDVTRPELVILTQENKLLANYLWQFRRLFSGPKVAFWGHGRNFQSDAPRGLRERWKRLFSGEVDRWFAYTVMTRDILLADGYPSERITVLDNAIDNDGFQADLGSISDGDLLALREIVGAGPVGLFCGSLYPDKRLDFMIAAADRIRQTRPDFALVVIGDGPSASEVRAAAETRPWLHVVGVKKGREKAAWFRLASVVLNPGLVGLHIVDSFCAGVPMVTTADARHSPEIAYLDSGVNGLIVHGGVPEYADAVLALLADPVRAASMRAAALASASRYTLDNMVANFCDGIERCLALPKK